MAEPADLHRRIFARIYPTVAAASDARGGAEHRITLLRGLSGRVVEVGAGPGRNFAHYPKSVIEVVAVEPESTLRALAEHAASTASVPTRVVPGLADRLPCEDGSFDAGVASLLLCSVPDPGGALGELFRVIRSGGELRFYEHVRSERPVLFHTERAVDLVWPRVAGGCHLSRDTLTAIAQAGFVVESYQPISFACVASGPRIRHILGSARRP
jgi:ubiquinone/menaquinone biosynthesis C-methylase UbiE